MIGFLDGIYRGISDNNVLIDCNGVGYEVFCTNSVLNNLPIEGENFRVFTYLNVKEDEMSLFGFINLEEKKMFLKLITVSGIGAKTAIQILSGIRFNDLVTAIVSEDSTMISLVKGIGKKTAERIVLELKNSINAFEYLLDGVRIEKNNNTNCITDAVVVLTNLGMKQNDATQIAREVAEIGDTSEQIVSKVLKRMGA